MFADSLGKSYFRTRCRLNVLNVSFLGIFLSKRVINVRIYLFIYLYTYFVEQIFSTKRGEDGY